MSATTQTSSPSCCTASRARPCALFVNTPPPIPATRSPCRSPSGYTVCSVSAASTISTFGRRNCSKASPTHGRRLVVPRSLRLGPGRSRRRRQGRSHARPGNAAQSGQRQRGARPRSRILRRGAPAEGEALIETWLPDYDRSAVLHGHLSWHRALFALQRGRHRTRLRYLCEQRPPRSLARVTHVHHHRCCILHHADGHRGIPAGESRDSGGRRVRAQALPKPGAPFVNAHLAMAYAARGTTTPFPASSATIATLLDEGAQTSGPVISLVCEAIAAYGRGQHETARERMGRAMSDLERLGGSHAQRDVFIDLAISAGGARWRAGRSGMHREGAIYAAGESPGRRLAGAACRPGARFTVLTQSRQQSPAARNPCIFRRTLNHSCVTWSYPRLSVPLVLQRTEAALAFDPQKIIDTAKNPTTR